jgi:hypothetical protein
LWESLTPTPFVVKPQQKSAMPFLVHSSKGDSKSGEGDQRRSSKVHLYIFSSGASFCRNIRHKNATMPPTVAALWRCGCCGKNWGSEKILGGGGRAAPSLLCVYHTYSLIVTLMITPLCKNKCSLTVHGLQHTGLHYLIVNRIIFNIV